MFLKFFMLLSICLLSAGFATEKTSCASFDMKSIDEVDKQILDDFFRCLFFESEFAYTLFGDKPLTLITPNLQCIFFLVTDSSCRYRMSKIVLGWKVWKKYQSSFPFRNFYFDCCDDLDGYCCKFVLINRKKCLEIIKNNFELFTTCFGAIENPEIFLKRFASSSSTYIGKTGYFFSLGLLLGYGEENARTFERNENLYDAIIKTPLDSSFLNQKIKISSLNQRTFKKEAPNSLDCRHTITELNYLDSHFRGCFATLQPNPLYPFDIPHFRAILNKETETIKKIFDQNREKLLEAYYSDNFLERVLNQMAS